MTILLKQYKKKSTIEHIKITYLNGENHEYTPYWKTTKIHNLQDYNNKLQLKI